MFIRKKIENIDAVLATDYRSDGPLLVTFLLLLGAGYVMMASASMEYASLYYEDPWYYVSRQGIYIVVALLAMVGVLFVDTKALYRRSGAFLLLGLLLLFLVLLPFIGVEVNGSRRWLNLGVINFQISELVKFLTILYLASYLVRREREVRTKFSGFVIPLLILAALIALLLQQPDFGTVVVMLAVVLGMLFLAGVRISHFLVVIFVSACVIAMMAWSSPYRMKRIVAYLDPWSQQYDGGYQLVQSLIAFGRGEWWGQGLGQGVQKLFYLPEAHTDFVFAIVGEELGFIGAALVLLLFSIFLWRIFRLAWMAQQHGEKFVANLCFGIALLFCIQIFINVGVNVGVLPTKGLTLPFFSYGGSSLLMSCLMVAVVFRCHYELFKLNKLGWRVEARRSRSLATEGQSAYVS